MVVFRYSQNFTNRQDCLQIEARSEKPTLLVFTSSQQLTHATGDAAHSTCHPIFLFSVHPIPARRCCRSYCQHLRMCLHYPLRVSSCLSWKISCGTYFETSDNRRVSRNRARMGPLTKAAIQHSCYYQRLDRPTSLQINPFGSTTLDLFHLVTDGEQ